jgi:hypothetical protein
MYRNLGLVVILLVVAVGGYLLIFKRGDVDRARKGYKSADTPQLAAEMFKKAMKEREFEIASDYCTAGYADQLKRGAKAANEFGEALDNTYFQMDQHKLIRDELKVIFYNLDPFPKDFEIIVSKEAGDTAAAEFRFNTPVFKGDQPSAGSWSLKPDIFQTYVRSLNFRTPVIAVVPMKKEGNVWKFDIPADNALQARVGYLNDKYMNYVNPLKKVSEEVKNDPSTKENVTQRLRTLLEQAAKE